MSDENFLREALQGAGMLTGGETSSSQWETILGQLSAATPPREVRKLWRAA